MDTGSGKLPGQRLMRSYGIGPEYQKQHLVNYLCYAYSLLSCQINCILPVDMVVAMHLVC